MKKSVERLKKVRSQDKEFRVEYLLDLAEKYSRENDISKEKAIRELLSHEDLRETYRKIDEKMNRARSPKMSTVWLKGVEEEDKFVIEGNEEVERHLLQRNKTHLQQANETPFAEGDKSVYLGDHGDSDFINRVLEGDYLPEMNDSDETVLEYIKGLRYTSLDIPNSINTDLTLEEYQKFWKTKK